MYIIYTVYIYVYGTRYTLIIRTLSTRQTIRQYEIYAELGSLIFDKKCVLHNINNISNKEDVMINDLRVTKAPITVRM